jgi:hypothetical protein
MRKTLTLMFAIVMLAACGGTTNTGQSATPTIAPTASTSASPSAVIRSQADCEALFNSSRSHVSPQDASWRSYTVRGSGFSISAPPDWIQSSSTDTAFELHGPNAPELLQVSIHPMAGTMPSTAIIAVAEGTSAQHDSRNVGAVFLETQLPAGPAAAIFRCDRTGSGDVVVALQFLLPRKVDAGHFKVYLLNFLAQPSQYRDRADEWALIAGTFRFRG